MVPSPVRCETAHTNAVDVHSLAVTVAVHRTAAVTVQAIQQ